MKILFFGLGSIGRKHFKLLQDNFDFCLSAFRTYKGNTFQSSAFEINSWDLVDIYKPDVAFICNPSALHIETAIWCAERGMHLFIEKPIGVNTTRLDELLSIVEKNKLTTYVAYDMRHHPKIIEAKNHLKDRRCEYSFIICESDSKKWPCKRKLDDVLLELSHELDYAEYLFGEIKEIHGFNEKNFAELSTRHASGTISIISLSMRSDTERRLLRCFGSNKDEHFSKNLLQVSDSVYLTQLKYFFNNLSNPRMMNNLFEATPLFRKIIAFKDNAI